MPTEGTPDTLLCLECRRHPRHSRRRKRTDALRNAELYFAESTRVLAAKYADALRKAPQGIGQGPARPCAPPSGHRPTRSLGNADGRAEQRLLA